MDNQNCPICHGTIIISTNVHTHGCGGYFVLNEVFCEICKTLFHRSILGDFVLIKEKPFWRRRTTETCKTCAGFAYGDHCAFRGPVAHRERKACQRWQD